MMEQVHLSGTFFMSIFTEHRTERSITMKLLKGNIIHAPTLEKLETIENGALLLEDDGTIREVLHAAPQDFDGRVYDCSGQLIMQSFADMAEKRSFSTVSAGCLSIQCGKLFGDTS